MAKNKVRPTDVTPESKRVGSEIGFKLNQKSREAALNSFDTVTEQREKQGWLWVKKGNSKKQIKPENLNFNLGQGWELIA